MEIVLPIIISSLLKGCLREDYNKSNRKTSELDSKDIIKKCDITSNGLKIKWNKKGLKLEDVSSYEVLVYKKKDMKYQIYRQIDVKNKTGMYKDRYNYTPGTYKVTIKFYNNNLYNQTSIQNLHISSSKLKTINRQSKFTTVAEYFVGDTISLQRDSDDDTTAEYYIDINKQDINSDNYTYYTRFINVGETINISLENKGDYKFELYKESGEGNNTIITNIDTLSFIIKEKDIYEEYDVLKINDFDNLFEDVPDDSDQEIIRKSYIIDNLIVNANNKIIDNDSNILDSIRFSPSDDYFLIISVYGEDISQLSFQLGTISTENNDVPTVDLSVEPLLDEKLGNIYDLGSEIYGALDVKNRQGTEYILNFKNNSSNNKTINVYFEQKPLIQNNQILFANINEPYNMTLAGYTSDLIEFSVDPDKTDSVYLDFRFYNTNDRDIELYLYEKIQNGNNILYANTSTDDYQLVDEDNTKTKISVELLLTSGNYILTIWNPDDDGRRIEYGFDLNTNITNYKTIKPLETPLSGFGNQIQLDNQYYNNQHVDITPVNSTDQYIFDEYRNIQLFNYVDSEPFLFTIKEENPPDDSIIGTNKYVIKFLIFGGIEMTIELFNKDTGDYYFNDSPNNGTLFFVQNFKPGKYECRISQKDATPGSTTHSVFTTFDKYLDKQVIMNNLPTFSPVKTNLASEYRDSNDNIIIVSNAGALQGDDNDEKTYYLTIIKSDGTCGVIGYKKVGNGNELEVVVKYFTTDLNNDRITFEADSDILQYNGFSTDPVSTYIMDIDDTTLTYTIKVKNIHNDQVVGPYTNFSQLNINVCFYETPDEQYNDIFNESTILAYNIEEEDSNTIHSSEQIKELSFNANRQGKYLVFVYAISQLFPITSYDLEITSQ